MRPFTILRLLIGIPLGIIGLAGVPEDMNDWANCLAGIDADLARWIAVGLALALIGSINAAANWSTLSPRIAAIRPHVLAFSRERRIPLMKLRELADRRGWSLLGDGCEDTGEFCDVLKQAGRDGKLSAWGRPPQMFDALTKQQPLRRIEPQEWQDNMIDGSRIWGDKDNNFHTRLIDYPFGIVGPRTLLVDLHVDQRYGLRAVGRKKS